MDGRSTRGCWTCRARRKKCDEQKPECTTCKTLELPCHGFGPRPVWMNGGSQERARAIEFKGILKRRRRKRHSSSDIGSFNGALNDDALSLSHLSSFPAPDYRDGGPLVAECLEQLLTPVSTPVSSIPTISSDNLDAILSGTAYDFFDNRSIQQDFSHPSPITPHSLVDIGTSRATGLPSGLGDVDTSTASLKVQKGGEPSPFSPVVPLQRHDTDYHGQLAGISAFAPRALCSYLQTMFTAQLPFLDSARAIVIGDEVMRLTRTSSCCLASLRGADLFEQQMQLRRLGLSTQQDLMQSARSQARLARQELPFLFRKMQDDHGLGEEEESRCENLVCVVLNILSKKPPQDSIWVDLCEMQRHLEPLHTDGFSNDTELLIKQFQGVLCCFSALSCISTATAPIFANKVRAELAIPGSSVEIENVLGCRSSILKPILDIADLQCWKKTTVEDGSSSTIELVKRALPIEAELNSVRGTSSTGIESNSETSLDADPLTGKSAIVTNIYACAAGVYLYGVLSSLNNGSPELASAIADTIAALKLIPQASLVKALVWPIGVAALASEQSEHRHFFRELAQGILELWGRCEVYLALEVAFEFWERSGSTLIDRKVWEWQEALGLRGEPYLLFL